MAIGRPDLVRKLVAIGANYDPTDVTPEAAEMFARMAPDDAQIAALRELYGMHSPDGPVWTALAAADRARKVTPSTDGLGVRAVNARNRARIGAGTTPALSAGVVPGHRGPIVDHWNGSFTGLCACRPP